MTRTLPTLLGDMIAAHNAHDPEAFLACFAADAIIRDEGRIHHGQSAVRGWFEDVCRKYRPVLTVTDLTHVDGEPVIAGEVAGNFPGSPIALRYYLGLEHDKIVSLRIAAGHPVA